MFGLGTILNTALIVLGGIFGILFGKKMKKEMQDTLTIACGVGVLILGIAGVLEGILKVDGENVTTTHSMLMILCLIIGGFLGELINIEKWFTKFGEFLQRKTGSSEDQSFISGFLTASFTVCIGAMAIVGSFEDGINFDYSILLIKGILDFITVMVLCCSYGKGPLFSAIPVFVIEGVLTVLAYFCKNFISDLAIFYLSMVGSVLIFCVGLNLVFDRKIRISNFLPAIILAAIAAYIPLPL